MKNELEEIFKRYTHYARKISVVETPYEIKIYIRVDHEWEARN